MPDDGADLRWLVVCGVLLLVMCWEQRAPLRAEAGATIRQRWPANIALLVANNLLLFALAGLVRLLPGGDGPSPLVARLPDWLALVVTVAVLDLLLYVLHVAFHRVPWLWRIHRMHHTDVELDVTTSFRFHPLDVALTALLTAAVFALLGATPLTVLAVGLMRAISDGLAHGNIRVPAAVDRLARAVVVTPYFHRVHHSTDGRIHDSNYGNLFTWWDYLFGTYHPVPAPALAAMRMGLEDFREPAQQRLVPLLVQPFARG